MLRVFEAFAGYGSQRMALRNLNIPHEVVGISEIEGGVLYSYAAIHTDFLVLKEKLDTILTISREEMLAYLNKINVPLDYKTFENKAESFSLKELRLCYFANKIIRNYGDIRRINPLLLPDFDLFTYSFPCQDISLAGKQQGLDFESNTRSSLLWECCKIIVVKKPKYLLMENVKNLIGPSHKKNFLLFLDFLENAGYKNFYAVLNARDFGVPQNRERVFCVSVRDKSFEYEFPKPVPLVTHLYDLLEQNPDERYYLKNNQFLDKPIKADYSYCLDCSYWKGTTLSDYFKRHRRQLVTDRKSSDNRYLPRRLTPREAFRLMGVSDADYNKACSVASNTSLYKQAGNSIVVPVLEAIFKKLFAERVAMATK